MKVLQIFFCAALAAQILSAESLSVVLNPAVETVAPLSYSVAVDFNGTLTDLDTANTCDSSGTDCLFLNNVVIAFDSGDPAGTASNLTLDTNPFFNVLPFLSTCPGGGILSDDSTGSGAFDICGGPIFAIDVAPGTPSGAYSGTVTIEGGHDDPTLLNSLATAQFTVVVAPEPASFGLAMAGFVVCLAWVCLAWVRRGASS